MHPGRIRRDILSNVLAMTRITTAICVSIALFLTSRAYPASQALPNNANCLMCHSAGSLEKSADGMRVSMYVDPSYLHRSAHGSLKCVECHADLQDKPVMHAGEVAPAQCARCHTKHPDEVHAGMEMGKTAPACWDCHGSHDIKPVKDRASKVSRENSIGTCARCHADVKSLQAYRFSAHGTLKKEGELPAAVCTDCHKTHQPRKLGLSVDCMTCHAGNASEYMSGTHGTVRAKDDLFAPACVDCHGGHDVLKVSDPRSPMNRLNEPRTCGKCHDDEERMAKYGVPTNRLKIYRDSFHGKANLLVNAEVATCSDCHGAHKVLPSSNPASSTNKNNLGKTCARCHPGANMNVGKGLVHVEITREGSPLLYYVSTGFKWLTIITMVMLCGHILLDLFSRVRRKLMGSLRRGS